MMTMMKMMEMMDMMMKMSSRQRRQVLWKMAAKGSTCTPTITP